MEKSSASSDLDAFLSPDGNPKSVWKQEGELHNGQKGMILCKTRFHTLIYNKDACVLTLPVISFSYSKNYAQYIVCSKGIWTAIRVTANHSPKPVKYCLKCSKFSYHIRRVIVFLHTCMCQINMNLSFFLGYILHITLFYTIIVLY